MRRASKLMTRTSKALTFTLAGLAVLIAAAPWLVPMGRFIPAVEAEASARLRMPVKIAGLRLSLVPLPHLTATRITAGEAPLASVERLTVYPNPLHLFSETRVLDEIRLEKVWAKPEFLLRLAALKPTVEGPPGARVRRVVLKDVEVRLDRMTLAAVDAVAQLAEDGAIAQVQVRHHRERLVIVASPEADGFKLSIAGRKWTPPAGPPILFDRLEATGQLTERGISTGALSASLYGGSLTGQLSVSWRPTWAVSGQLKVAGLELEPLAAMLAADTHVTGRLTASPWFTLRAREASRLPASLRLESDFSVEQGVLQRVDLEAAARNPLSRDASRHGSTRFDRLTGRLEVDRTGYHFCRLDVATGVLSGTGEVSVLRDQRLDGRIYAQLKGTGSLLTVPLQVSGTVQEPTVLPTKAAVAGAVAGSVLLPGIGTAVGLKAGQFTERLLGRRRDSESRRDAPDSGAPDGRINE
jgi:hypothetical protein